MFEVIVKEKAEDTLNEICNELAYQRRNVKRFHFILISPDVQLALLSVRASNHFYIMRIEPNGKLYIAGVQVLCTKDLDNGTCIIV